MTSIHLVALLIYGNPLIDGDHHSIDQPSIAVEARPDLSLSDQVKAFKQQFDAWEQTITSDLIVARAAGPKGSDARSKAVVEVIARSIRSRQAIINQVIRLVRDHPNDPAAFEGILLLRADFDDDLLEIARDHFRDDPRIGWLCMVLPDRTTDSSKAFLKQIASKNPVHQTRGQATYSLGLYVRNLYERLVAERRMTDSEQEQLLGEFQRRIYKQMIVGRRPTDQERKELLAEARTYFDQVVREYPDVLSADGTFRLADKAKAELVWIDQIPRLKVGQVAPRIIGEDLDGQPLNLDQYRGKVVVLCFWATWCEPCMAMVPHERELVRRMAGKPFALVGVNCDEADSREKARKVTLDRQMTWPSGWDGGWGGPIQTQYNIDHYPSIFVLDTQGIIRFIDTKGKDLDEAVDALLMELKTTAK